MPAAKGSSSGRLPGSRGGSSRGGSFLSKQGGSYTASTASKASRSQSGTSATSPKAFRKGNAAANRDLGWSKSTDRASKKYGSGRMAAEGPKRSVPVKKRGR